jgi:hypothetical protein
LNSGLAPKKLKIGLRSSPPNSISMFLPSGVMLPICTPSSAQAMLIRYLPLGFSSMRGGSTVNE